MTSTSAVHRAKPLNHKPIDGRCVLYVMSRDQRVEDNFALSEAQQTALQYKLPLAVVFCLMPKTGFRAREHYQWMLAGLLQVERDLAKKNIPFMMLIGDPIDTLKGVLHHLQPAAVYYDFSPLAGPRRAQDAIAKASSSAVFAVDTHNIVPVWDVSPKQEFAARTLRPKVHRILADGLEPPAPIVAHPHKWKGTVRPIKELQSLVRGVLDQVPFPGRPIYLPL